MGLIEYDTLDAQEGDGDVTIMGGESDGENSGSDGSSDGGNSESRWVSLSSTEMWALGGAIMLLVAAVVIYWRL